jgi:hypothetical protein
VNAGHECRSPAARHGRPAAAVPVENDAAVPDGPDVAPAGAMHPEELLGYWSRHVRPCSPVPVKCHAVHPHGPDFIGRATPTPDHAVPFQWSSVPASPAAQVSFAALPQNPASTERSSAQPPDPPARPPRLERGTCRFGAPRTVEEETSRHDAALHPRRPGNTFAANG